MKVDYKIINKFGKIVVIYRDGSGHYEVWKEYGHKSHEFMSAFYNEQEALGYAIYEFNRNEA